MQIFSFEPPTSEYIDNRLKESKRPYFFRELRHVIFRRYKNRNISGGTLITNHCLPMIYIFLWIWKLNLKILTLNHMNDFITKTKQEMEVVKYWQEKIRKQILFKKNLLWTNHHAGKGFWSIHSLKSKFLCQWKKTAMIKSQCNWPSIFLVKGVVKKWLYLLSKSP